MYNIASSLLIFPYRLNVRTSLLNTSAKQKQNNKLLEQLSSNLDTVSDIGVLNLPQQVKAREYWPQIWVGHDWPGDTIQHRPLVQDPGLQVATFSVLSRCAETTGDKN